MKSWLLSLSAAALLALAAPIYAIYAQTPPGNPGDAGVQPPVPAAEQPTGDTAEAPTPAAPEASSADAVSDTSQADTRFAAILPEGFSEREACSGLKNKAECFAALHVAHNLGIAFPDLKGKLAAGERLTFAVNELKPGTDAKSEVRKALEQAQMDLRPPKG